MKETMLPKSLARGFRSGYHRASIIINRAFNFGLALILLVLALPVFIALALAILICDGRPIFYAGPRLGLHKKPFMIYKFRTLVPDANKIIGAQLLSSSHKLVTPIGQYLRDCRLDELPQLFNVLKGDMDFIGPRPERPEIYERICRHIRDYDKRFLAKPGLIGYSQLFTPHSTPKRIRAFIDNRLMTRKQIMFWDLYVTLLTGFIILRSAAYHITKRVYSDLIMVRILRRYKEKRVSERIPHHDALVYFSWDEKPYEKMNVGQLMDINEEAFLMRCDHDIGRPFPSRFRFQIVIDIRRGNEKKRSAMCTGELYKAGKCDDNSYEYVVMYDPISPLNFYMIHQYFLKKSIA